MNCIELFAQKSQDKKEQLAFVSPYGMESSFGDLRQKVIKAQQALLHKNVKATDSVLIAIGPSIELYALVIAVMGLGASVVLVEPWMPIKKIAEVIKLVSPKIFISTFVGNLWGLRVSEIRHIPHWMRPHDLFSFGTGELIVESVDEQTPGIITFTSGTSGVPKGVVRGQGYLLRQFEVLNHSLHFDRYTGSDLCIFANWTLLNLAQGKPTVFFPMDWSEKNFKWLAAASSKYKIETLTSGPAFIKAMNKNIKLSHVKDIHIGGALIPCTLLEEVIGQYSDSQILQVYGSSEVEPVSLVDARVSVMKSKRKNYYHALHIGKPISEISFENKNEGMWVSGDHVCSFYLNNQKENELNKRRDNDGRLWHFMGDRIDIDADQEWWYMGRSQNLREDFCFEQELYVYLGHDRAFFKRNDNNEIFLIGENVLVKKNELRKKFPFIKEIYETKILTDKRHRSRIDRVASSKKIK